MKRLAAAVLLVACGGDDAVTIDPCTDQAGTCITLAIDQGTATSATIDRLALDLLYGTTHAAPSRTTTDPITLPAAIAITFDLATMTSVGIVVGGSLDTTLVGTAYGAITIAPGAHVDLALELAPPDACATNEYACGGDDAVGASNTLYRCDAEGIPRARGVCAATCGTSPDTNTDACLGVGTCVATGLYCGGDKLDGDPAILYRCGSANQLPTISQTCANGCVVAAAGTDDHCR